MTGDETLAEMGLGSAILETDPDQRHGADQTQPTPTYEEARAADAQLKQAWEAVGTARRALVDATTRAVAALEAFDRLDGKRRAYLDSDLATEPDASQVSEPDPQASSSEGTSRQEPTVGDTGTGTPATVTGTGPAEPVVAEEAPAEDPVWEQASLFMKTISRTVRELKHKLGGSEEEARALINAHMDEIQVITGAKRGIQERYRMLDPGEVKVEPVRFPPPGRRGRATETGTGPVEEGTREDPGAEGTGEQPPEVQLADGSFDDGYDGPFVDIRWEDLNGGQSARQAGSRQSRATTPQWTSIQDISAGIDATADPKRVVLLAVSSADEARTVLRNGLDPQTFGDDFRKGLQVEGVTSADVKGLLRKRAERIPEKDRKKAFVILGRAEYQDHIEPENIIGVAPMSTFRPSVVSLFEEETVTGTETAEESAADDITLGGSSDGML